MVLDRGVWGRLGKNMELAAALVAAAVPVILYFRRCRMIERLAQMADQSGATVKVSGINPLAVNVEYQSNAATGEQRLGSNPADLASRSGS